MKALSWCLLGCFTRLFSYGLSIIPSAKELENGRLIAFADGCWVLELRICLRAAHLRHG